MSGEANPLYNIQTEQWAIGAVIVRPSHIDALRDEVGLRAEHFYREPHQRIYRHCVRLYDGGVLDLVTLKDALARSGELEHVGGPAYIASLDDGMPPSANAPEWAARVRDYAERRELAQTLDRLRASLCETSDDWRVTRDAAMRDLLDVGQDSAASRQFATGDALAREFMTEMDRLAACAVNGVTGVPSGIALLDRMTTGFQGGDLIYVGGSTGMGKTSFAVGVAEHVLLRTDGGVAFFSIEMTRVQVYARLVASISGVSLQKFRTGLRDASAAEEIAVSRTHQTLWECRNRLVIDQTSELTVAGMRTRLRMWQQQGIPISLVVVDHVGLLRSAPGARHERRDLVVGEISHDLKALAKDFKLPVMALSQFARRPAQEQRRPVLSDLRDSGDLEQDADVVLFPYREGYHDGPDRQGPAIDHGQASIIIAKQRNGPLGDVPVTWDAECSRFSNRTFPAAVA